MDTQMKNMENSVNFMSYMLHKSTTEYKPATSGRTTSADNNTKPKHKNKTKPSTMVAGASSPSCQSK